jgi:alpha-tubulin suppressor-like RCC1 family protein
MTTRPAICLLLGVVSLLPATAGSDGPAAQARHRLQIRPDGTVWASGDNEHGQLGDGTRTRRQNFVRVRGLTDIVAVSTGETHSVALGRDGRVWSWGDNSRGQLGDNTRIERIEAVRVVFLDRVASLQCADAQCSAVKHDGSSWRWGTLRANAEDDLLIPSPVTGPESLRSR